ncbi:MAG: gamma carbonic anhydrase family protein [Terriglobia bacterium]|jgi:carbonic anhydrase/acetyltransferase-like protein (isoleucine patch superfamily)
MVLTYMGREPRIAASAFIAESADVIGDVEIGEDASIWFQTVLRGDIELIRVGAHSNIQDGSVLHTMVGMPTIVGDWVTVGHRVVLHGCTVENHCLIGMGAVLLNNVTVGEGSIVAAGALVLENIVIPPRSLYLGVPAKFQRQLTESDRQFIDAHATHYLQYKENYLAESGKKITR